MQTFLEFVSVGDEAPLVRQPSSTVLRRQRLMPTAAEWDMHARQTRSIADCAARFGDAATASFLRASVDEMERLAAIAAATDAGTKIRVNVTVLPVRGRHNHAHMRLDPEVTYPESPGP